MPYRSVKPLLTTWTVCLVCLVPVAHLDQGAHDEWHARNGDKPPAPEDDPGRGLLLTA